MLQRLFCMLVFSLLIGTITVAQTVDEAARKQLDSLRTSEIADDPERGIQWALDLDRAMRRAKYEGKPVIIFFSVRELGDPAAKRC